MNLTKKFIVLIELLTLIMLWACTFALNLSTDILWVNIVTGITISISSLGTGFLLYEIIKEWKQIESNKT